MEKEKMEKISDLIAKNTEKALEDLKNKS